MLWFLLVPCVLGGTTVPRDPIHVEPLGTGTGNDQYKPIDDAYYTPNEVYKAGDKDDCHPVEKARIFFYLQKYNSLIINFPFQNILSVFVLTHLLLLKL